MICNKEKYFSNFTAQYSYIVNKSKYNLYSITIYKHTNEKIEIATFTIKKRDIVYLNNLFSELDKRKIILEELIDKNNNDSTYRNIMCKNHANLSYPIEDNENKYDITIDSTLKTVWIFLNNVLIAHFDYTAKEERIVIADNINRIIKEIKQGEYITDNLRRELERKKSSLLLKKIGYNRLI